jgi:hypothetical protein
MTSRTVDCNIKLKIGDTDTIWECTNPGDIERDYEKCGAEKTASAREQELSDYLAWGMRHDTKIATGFVTPETIAADTAYQNYKKAKAQEKTAGALDRTPGAPERDFESLRAHALKECEYWRKVAEEHRMAHDENRGIALTSMHKLAEIFRRADRPNWTTFEGEVLAVHGKEASAFLDAIWDTGRLGSVRCSRAPGAIKVAYVNDGTELHKLFSIFKVASEIAAEEKVQETQYRERYQSDRAAVLGATKEAMMGAMMGSPMLMAAQLAGTYDQALQPPAPAKATINPNVGLESELQKARLQAVVRDMMANDEVISAHSANDPAKVVKIVEQLSQVHPKILDMPSVLQSGVRKALELGTIEPFELKQLQSLGDPTSPAPQPQA